MDFEDTEDTEGNKGKNDEQDNAGTGSQTEVSEGEEEQLDKGVGVRVRHRSPARGVVGSTAAQREVEGIVTVVHTLGPHCLTVGPR